MFQDLLLKLGVPVTELLPYGGSDLTSFNGVETRPLGYIELGVTFGSDTLSHTVKVQFCILPCQSPYNCIIGRPTLGSLGVVASTVHLKIKFYSH